MDLSSISAFEVYVALAIIFVTTLVLLLFLMCRPRQNRSALGLHLDWHCKYVFGEAVSDFHRRFARVPRRLDELREELTVLIDKLVSHLSDKGLFVHTQYVGSAYEGVKVAKSEGIDDLKFVVLVTMKPPKEWIVNVETVSDLHVAGHVFLSVTKGYVPGGNKTFFDNAVITERLSDGSAKYIIDGRKATDKFFEELRNWIDASQDRKEKILLRRHGLSVQMDVYEQKINSDRPYYTVDVVTTLDIHGYGFNVAKPLKNRMMPDRFAWRSLSSAEAELSTDHNDERVDRFLSTYFTYMLELEQHLGYRMQILSFAGYTIDKNDNNLVFKVIIVDDSQRISITASEIRDKPGIVRLNVGTGETIEQLSSKNQTSTLVNTVQKFILSSTLFNGKVHIRRDGPIVRLIVCDSDEESQVAETFRKVPIYFVDLILAYEVGGRLYVARPKANWYTTEMDNSKAWRRSYSVETRDALHRGIGCTKKILRVLKALRNTEVVLAPLSSYHLKTVILRFIYDSFQNYRDYFNEDNIGTIFLHSLKILDNFLKNKNLPHQFLPKVNLASHMADECISSMRCRLRELWDNEQEMMRALKAVS